MNYLCYLVSALLLAFPTFLLSQNQDTLIIRDVSPLENTMESFSEHADAEIDFSQLEDELEELRNKPVNLNSGNENELRRLLLINEQQIQNLLAYTAEFGQVASIYELQVIDGFNQEIIERLVPYITLTTIQVDPFKWKYALKFGHPEILIRYQRIIEPQAGYHKVSDSLRLLHPNDYYCGSPDGVYVRFLYKYKDRFQYGLVAEKDAGEPLFPKADSLRKGFDFYSGHLYLNNIGKLKYFAIGDFHVQFGQGLNLWTGLSMGKSAGALPLRKHVSAIRPHSSANEVNFMRGIAVTFDIRKFDISGFCSYRKRDANLIGPDTLSEEDLTISSIQETGYHRTPGELADKNKTRELILGGHASWNGYRFRMGITAHQLRYCNEIIPRDSEYSRFHPSGEANSYLGADYSYSYKRLTFYGEGSFQMNGGFAQIHGLSFTPDPSLSIATVFRNYPSNYYNSLSAAFGEGSNNTNEKGFYIGILSTPFRNVSITVYTDQFRYPWLRYLVDAPSWGHEYSAQLVYALGRKGEMTFRYRFTSSPGNIKDEKSINQAVGHSRRNYYQWQLKYQALSWLLVSNKVYFLNKTLTNNSSANGFFISQDLQAKPFNSDWILSFRYCVFDTDSYDTRMYAYENDVPNAFSVPALSGNGSRFYLMLKFRISKNMDCWLRYSRTSYSNTTQISAGPAAIQGSVKSDVHLMLKIKF